MSHKRILGGEAIYMEKYSRIGVQDLKLQFLFSNLKSKDAIFFGGENVSTSQLWYFRGTYQRYLICESLQWAYVVANPVSTFVLRLFVWPVIVKKYALYTSSKW